MPKPHFIFSKKKNAFSVHVKNLEQLDVKQIQQIEHFVEVRNGYFDFNTYVFTIRKNLDYEEFVKLLKTLHVNATTQEVVVSLQSSKRIGFGQYKGMLYSELPDSYLLWLKNTYIGQDREIICEEINKRTL
ncbi:putative quorum-sensing-regulated virulence factor [Sulfurimonas sp.]